MKLIISEKEIAAKRIAQILSGDGVKEEKVHGIPVHSFKNSEGSFKTIGLKGHILQVEFPEEYANWFNVPPESLINADIVKIPIEKRIMQALLKVSGEADEIIVATDYDREGELIGYDALQAVIDHKGAIPAERAKFSAITPKDIKSAFAKLQKIDSNLAFAGMARQDIDLIWGAVLTRFISLASYQTKDKFLSVGRVQTPTLALIVEKEIEIEDFVKTPYWQLKVKLLNKNKEEFEALHHKKRFLDEEEARLVFEKLSGQGVISAIKESVRPLKPPTPLNTTALIVAANALGFNPQKTINTAENLYMNGFISYPRTDNTVYPNTIDLKDILNLLSANTDFREMTQAVLSLKEIKPTRGMKKTTDHPPIYPAAAAQRGNLSEDEWKLYELIVRRFICTLLPEALMKNMVVNTDISGEKFISNGSNIIKEGWTKYYPYYNHTDVILPDLAEDEKVTVSKKEMLSRETNPPLRFNQAKLVEKMEELGLGTKATRHSIIQALITRGYVKGNPLEASKKAIAVIKALKEYAQKITSPEMTSELELDMDGIANGDLEKSSVVDISRKALKEIIGILGLKKAEIGQAIRDGIKEDEIVGKCPDPDCGGDLLIRFSPRTRKKFIGCSNYPKCDKSFSMPQSGLILTTETPCKECSFPVIRLIRKGKRPWDLCINPNCPSKASNMEKTENDDSKDQTKKAAEIVGKCQGAGCSGNLILRFSPKKGQYFIGCSRYPKCRKAYSLPQDGRIITTEDKCKSCSYPIIRIDMGEKGISDMCINPDCSEKK
ncbi:MAG: DNA topoisomerase I [Candidatus Humimicrobiaceae bacterium]